MTAEHLTYTSHAASDKIDGKPLELTFERRRVETLRANRYQNGLYVRVTGLADMDLLADMNPRLIQELGQTLEAAMARLDGRPAAVSERA